MKNECDTNKGATATSDINLFSTTSQLIGEKLLQGWIMLDSVCHICKVTPLLKQKNKEDKYCAQCNLFIRVEKNDHNVNQSEYENEETESEINKTNTEGKDDSEEKRECLNMKNENESYSHNTIINNWLRPDLPKEKEDDNDNNNNGCANSLMENSVKYIKEFKIQNGEWSDLLNKKNISKEEVKNLLEVKDYIKERCGYDVGKWLYFDNNQSNNLEIQCKMKTIETENVEKNEEPNNTIQNNYFKKNKSMNETKTKHADYDDTYFQTDYNKFKKESFILEKTKYVLYDKLEKYGACLEEVYEQTEESVFINKISEIIQTLKNINDIKSRITV